MTHLEVTRAHITSLATVGSVNVCVGLTVSGVVSLGLDKDEVMSHEQFVRALAENLARLIIDSDGELIDMSHVEMVELA